MSTNLVQTFIVAFVLSGIFIVAYLISSEILLSWIRRRHSETYKELGQPSLFTNNTMSNGNRVIKFLLAKEYLSLGEDRVRKLGTLTRTLFLVAIAMFAIAVIIFFVQATTH